MPVTAKLLARNRGSRRFTFWCCEAQEQKTAVHDRALSCTMLRLAIAQAFPRRPKLLLLTLDMVRTNKFVHGWTPELQGLSPSHQADKQRHDLKIDPPEINEFKRAMHLMLNCASLRTMREKREQLRQHAMCVASDPTWAVQNPGTPCASLRTPCGPSRQICVPSVSMRAVTAPQEGETRANPPHSHLSPSVHDAQSDETLMSLQKCDRVVGHVFRALDV